jgi:hypothetical protein
MEAVGGISAGITVGSGLSTLAKTLARAHKTLRYAKEEIKQIKLSLRNIIELREMFNDAIRDALEVQTCITSDQAKKLHENFENEGRFIWKRIHSLLDVLRPLSSERHAPRSSRLYARIQWYFKKDEILLLRASMDSLHISMLLFATSVQLAALLRIAESAPNDLPQRM